MRIRTYLPGVSSLLTQAAPSSPLNTSQPRDLQAAPSAVASKSTTFSPAIGEVLVPRIDAALQRVESHLVAIQKSTGAWDAPFVAGSYHTGMMALALAYAGDAAAVIEAQKMVGEFAQDQLPNGGFSFIAGGESSRSATRMVVMALEMIVARRERLAPQAQPIIDRAKAYLKVDRRPDDTVYGLMTDLISAVVSDGRTTVPDGGLLRDVISRYLRGDLSNLVSIYAPALALMVFNQPDFVLRVIVASLGKGYFEAQIERGRDGEGSWGWTGFGTALSVIALLGAGQEYASSRAVQDGVSFLHKLRAIDRKAWTHGDAWDTAVVSLALGALNGAGAAAAKRGVEVLAANTLDDGRMSFSLVGVLGDNDTTSTALRSFCVRYGVTSDAAERETLAMQIRKTVVGLVEYQQRSGGWGAFNKTAYGDPGPEGARSPNESTLDDAASPDLTGRVVRSLIASRDSGVLTPEQTQRVDRALADAHTYLVDVAAGRGRWWSRWTNGRLSGYAFVVPSLRRLGEAPDAPVFAKTRDFVLSQQNNDGGWGETIEADRGQPGRGPSSIIHTTAALVALIGTMKDSEAKDPALVKAIESGVAYVLSVERDGVFSNGRPLYTAVTGIDYYDADTSTTTFAAGVLALYRDFVKLGPEAAMRASYL